MGWHHLQGGKDGRHGHTQSELRQYLVGLLRPDAGIGWELIGRHHVDSRQRLTRPPGLEGPSRQHLAVHGLDGEIGVAGVSELQKGKAFRDAGRGLHLHGDLLQVAIRTKEYKELFLGDSGGEAPDVDLLSLDGDPGGFVQKGRVVARDSQLQRREGGLGLAGDLVLLGLGGFDEDGESLEGWGLVGQLQGFQNVFELCEFDVRAALMFAALVAEQDNLPNFDAVRFAEPLFQVVACGALNQL